jgi:MYXO-CTERM domain-containing protein
MLEWLSDLFYDPWIFWGAPLILAAVLERLRRRRRATLTSTDES